jgi:8-oxo-dGTP pyrophosphatase MutT (NUDIX family)
MYKRFSFVLVIDPLDNILMGQRNDNKLFTNPGGHVENQECPFIAAFREFLEETGVALKSVDLLKVFFTKDKNLVYLFRGEMPEEYKFDTSKDPDKEVAGWKFVDPSDIVEKLHVPAEDNEIIKYWLNN